MKTILNYISVCLLLAISINAKNLECQVDQGKEQFMNCLIEKAKDSKSVEDNNLLGALYVADKDYNKAINWYKKSAEQGDAKAAFFLGGIYDEALGTPSERFSDKVKTYLLGKDKTLLKNQKEAIQWYKKAAKKDYPDAMPHLNEMMEKVYGKEGTIKRYKNAINKGEEVYWNKQFLANFYFRIGEYNKRIKIYNELIKEHPERKGDWLVSIGNTYMKDSLNNREKELEYYRQAAKYGNKMAMHNLGIYYGDIKDYKTAEMWFKQAGKPEMVCFMYKEILKDKQKTLECYAKLAESGKAKDLGTLAYVYDMDYNEHEKAIEFYKKAYELGNGMAANNIAVIYKYVYHDEEKALLWYKRAATLGYPKAIKYLKRKGEL